MTLAEENYLKSIYHLENRGISGVSTNAIAQKIEAKPSSVTDMVKRLAEKELLHHIKYQGVYLTEEGKKRAKQIIRKHRLWEVFLVEKLNFSWDEVHDVAEQLEHIKSKKLITELDRFLEFPKKDPHGDPIPDQYGNFQPLDEQILAQLEVGESAICAGVKDSSKAFLHYLDQKGIKLGDTISIVEKEPFDQSMVIALDERQLTITDRISKNISVKRI
ncbi:metal-dependent transcriptional regulator [Gangjinia marincola]|uniref:Transcriptional regulator MntR n=1 Tax=Gangjinia marincola TaxID=578463 RepID=A0ABP3XTX5_9FLAO